jgi:DNA helicase-2/ATP-dependent DNA helicase PcrA
VSAASEWRFPDGDDGAGEPPSRTVLDALRGFLESVALVSDADVVDAERGAVTLMTLHAAKGLEFDTVAIVGLEEGSLPHQRALEDRDGLEEERRLLFVGMTRAERRLQLSNAANRTVRGLRQSTIESQFLAELPGETLAREDRLESYDRSRIEYDADAAIDDGMPSAKRMFPVGCLVRHPQFGVGRVEHVVDRGTMSSARVAFRAVGLKTLVLSYARLERIDG